MLSPSSAAPKVDRAMQALQGSDLERVGRALGLSRQSVNFATPAGQRASVLFVTYWSRISG